VRWQATYGTFSANKRIQKEITLTKKSHTGYEKMYKDLLKKMQL